MRDERTFDLGRAEAMARDVEHVVHASRDPVIPVRVAFRAVAGEVLARESAEIGVDEPLVVAEHRAHLPGPAVDEHEVALARALERVTVVVDDRGLHAEERLGRGARLLRDRARQRRDQDSAGLRLPPRVDDRAARIAHDAVVPLPRLGVDRLADGAEQPQRRSSMFLDRAVALAHQRAQRRGRSVEDRDLVLVADLPETARVGEVRHALEHQ